MRGLRYSFVNLSLFVAGISACSGTGSRNEAEEAVAVSAEEALTTQDRLSACAQDPRVQAGLVSQQICAGADIFFRETFGGNGRTCGTCHSAGHNFTIDNAFIATLPASDPLFVAEQNPDLSALEGPDLRAQGGVIENVDGLEDPTHKFVVRGVPHLFSMSTSITRDPGDGTASPPVQRTGWSGDGAPNTGSLRDFLTGAVIQHYPKHLARTAGVDFRLPTDQELDLVLAFQASLGRSNELDLNQVNLFDADANEGRRAFMDPQRGRCNVCHGNAGANFLATGLNRNFDTGVGRAPIFATTKDGGFGGKGLASPNFDTDGDGVLDAFGDGTFNIPPLIEAADTGPFFHTNSFPILESAVDFYNTSLFNNSPAGLLLAQQFGGPIAFPGEDVGRIGRFLRSLNCAFNLDLAKQRLQAALTLVNRFHDTRADVQLGLVKLAQAELNDALRDINDGVVTQPMLPVAQDRIGLASSEITAALSASSFSSRAGHISTAISRVENARDQIGANVTFKLGSGDLMF